MELARKAKSMERINEDRALEMYLDIYENYTSKFSSTYESTIRLLEKKRKYEKALEVCNKTLQLIDDDVILATRPTFERKKGRLESKINSLKPIEKPAPEKFKFSFPKFEFKKKKKKSKNRNKKTNSKLKRELSGKNKEIKEETKLTESKIVTTESFNDDDNPSGEKNITSDKNTEKKIEVTSNEDEILTENTNKNFHEIKDDNINKKKNKFSKRNIIVTFSLILLVLILFAVDSWKKSYDDIQVDLSEKEALILDGELFDSSKVVVEDDTTPEYLITASMITNAQDAINSHFEVENSQITVYGDVIGFAILSSFDISDSKSEELGEEIVELLGGLAKSEYPELMAQGLSDFGNIYNYYSVVVAVGPSQEDIRSKGTMAKESDEIYWRESN